MSKHGNKSIGLMWVLAILVNIKSIFTDFGADQAYAVATSYRHLMGDGLFREMCEPHQTSCFLTDILMMGYRFFKPDFEGVAIYLQICGVLLYGIVTWILYKELVKHLDKPLAHFICILFFVFRPKQSVFPEFSNMQICFSVLLFVCLVKFLKDQTKSCNLIGAAVFLCLEVLAYPTCLLSYFGVVILLYTWSEKKWKNIGIFTGVCALLGGGYIAVIIARTGVGGLLESVSFLSRADASHGESAFQWSYYWSGFANGLLWLAGIVLLACLFTCLCKRGKKHISFFSCLGMGLLISEMLLLFLSRESEVDWTSTYFILILLLMGMGCVGVKYLDKNEAVLYYAGIMISVWSAVSVLFLTNLEFLSVVGYLILGGMVSLLPLNRYIGRKEERSHRVCHMIIYLMLLIIFHRGMVVCGYANEDGIKLTMDVENIIRQGPAKGVVCSLQKCNEVRYSREDWGKYVDEDTVLVVVPWLLDSMLYVHPDTEVATFSTIDTPTYDEGLLEYWARYPEKVPTVIAVESWNGEISIAESTWMMEWIEENYPIYEDGYFWRFYRKE